MAKDKAYQDALKIIRRSYRPGRTYLYLDSFKLSELPPDIEQLKNLQNIYFQNNRLTRLPPEIGQLKNLRKLYLHNNQLTSLPPEIGQLKKLKRLNLDDNRFPNVPPEIGQLKELRYLSIQNSLLTSLPPQIGKLKKLNKLRLQNNQITSLPPEIGQLEKLKELDLSNNQITNLPTEIGKLKHLETLSLDGNPIDTPPPEIVKQGAKAVVEYFKTIEKEELRAVNEVKVLFVGGGGSGKTSLVKQLFGKEFDHKESKTHGIRICKGVIEEEKNTFPIKEWEEGYDEYEKNIAVNFWDFGGQQIMHATHQFFLSERSLYILVLDGRKEEDAEYWLKHIESFGGDSPIIVVMNKIDEQPYDLDRRFLQRKYKEIKGFYPVSCSTRIGIDILAEYLIETLSSIDHVKTMWPVSWFNVKNDLKDMKKEKKHFIGLDDFIALCKRHGIKNEKNQEVLVDFLHDLGVVLHFRDFQLLDTHVLEPGWVTEGVYKIINSEFLSKSNGLLSLSLLKQILNKKDKNDYHYPSNQHRYFIDLMKKFELCYMIDNESVLIPDLLEKQEPDVDLDYNMDTDINFLIDYDFLPKSVIPRFIVRMNKDIKKNSEMVSLQWRTGVVLEDKTYGSIAVIIADEKDKVIKIYVDGQQKREYLSVIRHAFLTINSSFNFRNKPVEKVPLPDNAKIATGYNHLLRLEKLGIEEFLPEGSEKNYNVKELLGSVNVETKLDKILNLLNKIYNENDTRESLMEKTNKILKIQPQFLGLSLDVNEIINRFYKKYTELSERLES